MRRAIILSLLLCSMAQGANEINSFIAGASNAFAVVRNGAGLVWYPTGQAFELWGNGTRDADAYDISLTDKSGGFWLGDFDTNISAGYYYIITHQDADATPDDADPPVWVERGYWDTDEWFKGATFQDVNDLTINVADVNTAVWSSLVADFTGELTFGGEVGGLDPNITLILADTHELQTDWTDGGRLDLLIDAIKYKTDLITLLDTTVADGNDANNFTISDGVDVNDALWFHIIIVEDADDSHYEARFIDRYDENSTDPNVWVDEPFSFTPAAGDVVHVMGTGYGGFLYDILRKINQNIGGDVNIIDTTRSIRPSTGTMRINIIDDGDTNMPGWP